MKTLGLIGGISWVSTIDYYRYINEGINKKLGGLEFSQCIIHSFNYGEVKRRNDAGDFEGMLKLLIDAALNLKQSGAEGLVLCANTMHMYADDLERAVGLPVIHVVTATAEAIVAQRINKVALLGTKFTMEKDFYKERLAKSGITTLIPEPYDRSFIHQTIFDELGKGIVLPDTRAKYLQIIDELKGKGAEGVILGCTEIPLLVTQDDSPIPIFDTARIHADAAVRFSLG